MPKRLSVILAMLCAVAVLLAACASAPPSSTTTAGKQPLLSAADTTTEGAEIALLLSDTQKNSARGSEVLNTVSTFGGEEGITTGTYIVDTADTDATLATLGLAAKGSARIVIAMGDEMAEAIRRARNQYPELYFILLDAEGTAALHGNAVVVHHSQVQAGWLAGYAAVTQGARQLAVFEAGDSDEAAQARALGFALGAEAAAAQLRLAEGAVELQPISLTDIQSITARRNVLRDMYAQGTDLVFINDTAYQSDTLMAAQGAEGAAVGVELGYIRDTVGDIASVERSIGGSLYQLLQGWAEGSFPEGGSYLCGIAQRGWTFSTTGFARFTEGVYTRLVESFAGNARARSLERMVYEDGELCTLAQLPLSRVALVEMEIAEEEGAYLPRRVGGVDEETSTNAATVPPEEEANGDDGAENEESAPDAGNDSGLPDSSSPDAESVDSGETDSSTELATDD